MSCVQNSRWLLGTGLLTAVGGAWRRQRRLIVDRLLTARLPSVSDLPSLTFVENVVTETMRLYSPPWSVALTADARFELEGSWGTGT